MAIKKIVILFIFLSFSFYSFVKKDDVYNHKYKLLIYAVINDSIELHRSDTAWLKSSTCINLKIDSIDLNSVLEFKKKEGRFYYKGNIFWNQQLFDAKDYKYLSNLAVSSFDIMFPGRVDPPAVNSNSNCLNSEQIHYIKSYYKSFKIRYAATEKMKIYFTQIKIINTSIKNLDLNLDLNDLECIID